MNESFKDDASMRGHYEIPVAGEPVPDWKVAKDLWGIAWEIHWISLGVMFAVLAVSSIISLLRSSKKKLGRKPYSISINILLLLLGITRAVYLLVDPYGSRQMLPRWFAGLIFNLSFPCLTSAFCLIFYVFLGVAKFQLVSKRLQNAGVITALILLHFIVVLAAVVCVIFVPEIAVEVYIICHLFFMVWGLILSASFIYCGLKVIRKVKTLARQLQHHSQSSISKIAKVTLVTSTLGLACSILHVYSLFVLYRFFRSNEERPEPWMWWIFQTCFRWIEIAMACTISYCIMQPPKRGSVSTRRNINLASIPAEKIISIQTFQATV